MTPKHAHKRYFKTTAISMIFYLLSVFGAALLLKRNEFAAGMEYLIAFFPALFVWWFMWGAVRYYRECDEYQRSRMTKAILLSLSGLMVFSSGWGFVELLADAPAFPLFYIFPLFCVMFGLAQYLTKAPGDSC